MSTEQCVSDETLQRLLIIVGGHPEMKSNRELTMALRELQARRLPTDDEFKARFRKARDVPAERLNAPFDAPLHKSHESPPRPCAWYRMAAHGAVVEWGDWPPHEPDDTAWQPLYARSAFDVGAPNDG